MDFQLLKRILIQDLSLLLEKRLQINDFSTEKEKKEFKTQCEFILKNLQVFSNKFETKYDEHKDILQPISSALLDIQNGLNLILFLFTFDSI